MGIHPTPSLLIHLVLETRTSVASLHYQLLVFKLLAPPTTTSQAIVDPRSLEDWNIGSAPSAPVSLGRGRQRTLAQPMGQNWARKIGKML